MLTNVDRTLEYIYLLYHIPFTLVYGHLQDF